MNKLMIVRALITFALLTCCFNAWGQDSLTVRGQTYVIRDLPSNAKTDLPLYIIKADGRTCQVPASGRFKRTRQLKRAFEKFNADLVQSIEVIKGKDATDKYGALGKYGVIVFNMKEGTYEALPRKLKKGCSYH